MSPKTALIAATGALLVLALGFGWHDIASAGKSDAALASVDHDLANLDASARLAQDRLAASQRDAAALRAKIQQGQAHKAAQITAAAGNRAISRNQDVLIASDPKLHDLYLKSFRAGLALRFGAMYQSLNLTPAQIGAFEDLETNQADDRNYIRVAALEQGISPNDPGVLALLKQNTDDFYAAVSAQVSPAASQQLMQTARTQNVQGIVNDIDSMVGFSSTPFTGAQGAQLQQILANDSTNYQSGGNANRATINWTAAATQVAAILSGPQLTAFNAEAQLQLIAQKMRQFYGQPQPGH